MAYYLRKKEDRFFPRSLTAPIVFHFFAEHANIITKTLGWRANARATTEVSS